MFIIFVLNHQTKPMSQKAICGHFGDEIRSDCQVELTITTSAGINLTINSRVERIYGDQMRSLIMNIMDHFGIKNANIKLEDSGAVEFVIAARMEAAIRMVMDTEREYLLPAIPESLNPSVYEKFRFTRLYLPGNTPKLMLNAALHQPDGLILDLEDSVAPQKKHEARFLVRNALRQVDFLGCERMVRINQLPDGLEDLKFIIPHNVHVVLVPKTEEANQVIEVDQAISGIPVDQKKASPVYIMPIIESAKGVEAAYEIALSSSRIVAVAIGLEDYTADLGVSRTEQGAESLYARTRVVNACKAAGIQPIDSVYSDVANTEGLKETALMSRSLGFEGMGCIHPRQIDIIRECFLPEVQEIQKAAAIVIAFEKAEKEGLGVVALGSKMIDPPVVKRALNTISLAENFDLIEKDWRNDRES
jgi:citrate lyase subunit beta/citryl-CoA lyase